MQNSAMTNAFDPFVKDGQGITDLTVAGLGYFVAEN